jgi:predicted aldo/keto reductase-like oxidoreductase
MNKLGFGFLRLPFVGEDVDYQLLNQMVDTFLEKGGRYFDTAYTYLNGKSEEAIRKSIVERHDRGSFLLANKLPGYMAKSKDDCTRYFQEQLKRCGVDYFDVYMLHWLNAANYAIAEKYSEFDFLTELKAQGKAKKIGFAYHDTAALLDEILTKHPEVDYVQLQINYLDWESESIQSRRCYETAVKHGKKVIVMEPVKGGTLANLPAEAQQILKSYEPSASMASHALRFAQSLPKVEIVLSGMNTMEQLTDNLQDAPPITEEHRAILQKIAQMLNKSIAIPCTGCSYCVKHCPKQIAIPNYFALYNEYRRHPNEDWKITPAYNRLAMEHGKASECIGCKSCERNCPQKLPISEYLKKVSTTFDIG